MKIVGAGGSLAVLTFNAGCFTIGFAILWNLSPLSTTSAQSWVKS